ncbi:hydrolase CocE/NonD family protein [Dorea longicatena]|nr:hydrolase CocE/NonD family protein [Dorea longicatena]
MRDGVTIYVDIYRPKDKTNIPVIISWSFYGKRPGDGMSEWQILYSLLESFPPSRGFSGIP